MRTEMTKFDQTWRLWCRLCAKEDPASNISVFFKEEQQQINGAAESVGGLGGSSRTTNAAANTDASLVEAIEKYFWVNISRTEEEMPKMLCTECLTLITSLVNFSERVAKVQQMFGTLQETRQNLDLHAIRLKYGLLDEEREHVMMPQPLPEVHFFEAKPKITEMADKFFDGEAIITNPLEQTQPRIRIKIKKEHLMDTEFVTNEFVSDNEDNYDEAQDNDATDDDVNNENDPFTDDADKDEDFVPSRHIDKDNNSSSDDDEFIANIKKGENESNLKEREAAKELCELEGNRKAKVKQRKTIKRHKRTKRAAKQQAAEGEVDNDKDEDEDNGSNDENAEKKDNDVDATFVCAECPSKFRRLQNFRLHMKTKHLTFIPLPQITCPDCPRVFTTQSQLEKHAKSHLPLELKKNCACPYCDKKFRWNTLVRTHIKHVHMNERPFICDECGVAVHTNAALKTHMLIHSDYAPFECEVCQKRFKERSRLNLHMETHNKDNKHICAECGQQLNSRVTLNRHLLVHSDKMQHKCDYCGRAFKRAKALKNHLILHTGLKPFSCDFCDRTFADGSNCRSHKKKAHPEELAALEAAGGAKPCTRNIPKLQTLKAITKAADNLAPVASKQSGCFAFGKKPKMNPLKTTTMALTTAGTATITTAAATTTATNTPKMAAATTLSDAEQQANPQISHQHDLNAMHSTLTNVGTTLGTAAAAGIQQHNVQIPVAAAAAAIPNIDNIYNHIMKQATIAAQNANVMASTYDASIHEE